MLLLVLDIFLVLLAYISSGQIFISNTRLVKNGSDSRFDDVLLIRKLPTGEFSFYYGDR